ncbi:MAG: hypothetical protein LBH09_02960 [Peptococcaceae bacterium]|jgi:uroporphyrinogen-III decarboxylase|nr:hypothetical protein [Peptococcaceae bacterium]
MSIKKDITEKENMILCIEGKKPAWLPSFYDTCIQVGASPFGRSIDHKTGYAVDIFGVEFTKTEDGPLPASNLNQDFRLKDIAKWHEVIPDINLKTIDWETEATRIRSMVPDDKMILYGGGPVWEELHYMMGFEEALIALIEEPEAVFDCLSAIADFWIEALRHICRHLKPDMVVFAEHMATGNGPLMSPSTYRHVIKPVHKKMFGAVRDLGIYTEMHCDGYIEPLIPDFAEIGVQALQPFQIFNDINKFKTEYAITAFGGWDCFGRGNQADSTEEEVRKSVRDAMDAYSPGYRYAFLQGGAAPRYKQNSEWLADEARRYGRTFY